MNLISVLIPTFNVENYIDEAIHSIINQSYFNLEIIIVDDASTDNTFQKLCIWKSIDKRIRVYRNAENMGIVYSLNLAYNYSNGAFICRMDGDDISMPNRIDVLHNYLKFNPHIDLVGSQILTIDDENRFLSCDYYPVDEISVYKGLNYRMTSAPIWLAKRIVYEKVGNYRFPGAEDYDFLLRMKTLGFRFCNVPDFLYKARVRQGNTLNSNGLRQRLSADLAYKLYKDRAKFCSENTVINHSVFLKKVGFEYFLKQKSLQYNSMANLTKSKLYYFYYMCFSIVYAPIMQFRFLYFRIRFKLLK